MACVGDVSCNWRTLAYIFGTLLSREQAPAGTDTAIRLVVHELRTPVAVIKAYAQLVEAQGGQKRPSASGAHEITAHILEQADLMEVGCGDFPLRSGPCARRLRAEPLRRVFLDEIRCRAPAHEFFRCRALSPSNEFFRCRALRRAPQGSAPWTPRSSSL
jgi:signal transduction histidine kinase